MFDNELQEANPLKIKRDLYHQRQGTTSYYLLSFLKAKTFLHQLNSKNNGSVLLCKAIFWH